MELHGVDPALVERFIQRMGYSAFAVIENGGNGSDLRTDISGAIVECGLWVADKNTELRGLRDDAHTQALYWQERDNTALANHYWGAREAYVKAINILERVGK